MANEFKNGVSYYVKHIVDPDKFSIYFPEGVTRCTSCKMSYSDSLGRPRCRLSDGRIIEQPLYYPELPDFCPLIPTGEIIGDIPKKKGDT